jgi:predicted permease
VLRSNPGFTTVAVLSLALGVGANTAIFQLLDALRIRALPVEKPRELVEIRIIDRKNATGSFSGRRPYLTNPMWERIRDEQRVFSGVLAWSGVGFDLAESGEVRGVEGLLVSGEFFQTLGVAPIAGRLFTAADDTRGCGSPGAVISHAFWKREFGGEPGTVGRTIRLDGKPFEILGITPARFFGMDVGRRFDVAVPICTRPMFNPQGDLDRRDSWFLAAMGRLKPGVTAEQATAQLTAISAGIFQTTVSPNYTPKDAEIYEAFKLGAFPAGGGVSTLRRSYETPLWVLLATTGLVLLIACANIANLNLAHATAREREMAVRLAIGASRGRIVRQLLAESLLLASCGAFLGALLAQWLSRFLVAFLSTDSNQLFIDLKPDWRVLGFTAALAVGTSILFGLTPAIRATRTPLTAALKAGSRGSTDTAERFGLRRALVVVQVALSLVLLVGALLFLGSLRNLITLDPGYEQDGLVTAYLDLRRTGVPPERFLPMNREITDQIRALPGIESAAEVYIMPMSGSGWNETILIGGEPQEETPYFNRVGPGYFRTMGTPFLAGRDFDDRDGPSSELVAIVTSAFAQKYFGGQSPLGKEFQLQEGPGKPRPFYRIVGLVKNSKYREMRDPFGPLVYLPIAQIPEPEPWGTVVVRSKALVADLKNQISRTVAGVHPGISLEYTQLKELIRRNLLPERLMATLTGFFGALAGLIAMIGLYGVMSYMVARRKNEIAIRMALGADRWKVVRMVVAEAGTLLAIGLVAGIVLAFFSAKTANALLYGLEPSDPGTLASAVVALAVVAALASYLPAARATRVEPVAALRQE